MIEGRAGVFQTQKFRGAYFTGRGRLDPLGELRRRSTLAATNGAERSGTQVQPLGKASLFAALP